MELNKFLRQLKKRWLLLIGLPLISMVITYFLVKDMPSSYTSQATLATGLVDETQHTLSVGGLTFQESQINQQFTNVVEMMKLKKMIDKVSFLLMIHDLSDPIPFKKPSKPVAALSEQDKKKSISFFKEKYEKEDALNLYNQAEIVQDKLLKSMKYDEGSINSSLGVYRKSNSDYIIVEFSSESPELSPFVVNTLCQEFIKSYDTIIQKNKGKASDFLAELLRRKYAAMNERIALLKDYKIHNKILNLYEQSKILYTNIVLIDSRKQDAQKDIEAYDGAINNIDSKFNPNDRKYLEGALTKLNGEILVTKTKLQTLSDQYLKSEYNEGYKKSIDSVQKILNGQINALTDQYIYDPLSSKKDLMGQKLALEIQRDVAKNSLNGLNRELNSFSQRFDRLVPFEAVIQSYERDIDIASREYLDVLNRYNQLGMSSDENVKLTQVQVAMPATGAPTKKILFVLIGGIVTFVLCVLVLFVLFFFDKSISTPEALVLQTQVPVLGHLSKLSGNSVDLYALWNDNANNNAAFTAQKTLLRSIRYEVLNELGTQKALCVTSVNAGSGSTFVAINLAYAFATIRKKVLLIDGNFANSSVSKILTPAISVENLFTSSYIDSSGFVTVAGNNSDNRSPFEIAGEQTIKSTFSALPFDVIIIDSESLDADNKTKEWIACADKVIGVFESRQTLTDANMQQIEWLKNGGKFAGWVFNKYSVTKA